MGRVSTSVIVAAACAAGPIFLLSSAVAALYLELPRPVVLEVRELVAFLPMLLAAAFAGFIPAFILNWLGAALMTALARLGGPARGRSGWILAGAGIGGLMAATLGADGAGGFALVVTSAACAAICRAGADVQEP
jgi:hypothetical protein